MGIFDSIIKQALEAQQEALKQALEAQQEALKTIFKNDAETLKKVHPQNLKTEKPKEWNLDVLMSLEWKRFEEVCQEYLIMSGFDARLTRSGADGEVDIQIYEKNQIVCLIQCKAWVWKISIKEIRELYGVMASEKVNNGIFITTSSYTQDVIAFSQEKKIRLFDGKEFVKRIKNLSPEKQEKLLTFATAGDYTTPTCASCEQKMVKRMGNNSGKDFWGCVNFPRCRSTIPARKIIT